MIRLPRNAQLWLPGLIVDRWERLRRKEYDVTTVWLTFADHFEPRWRQPEHRVAVSRVRRWHTEWPKIAETNSDHFGRPARYTFFYPEEEYHPDLVAPLADLARKELADVEVHIHHDGEGEKNFLDRMNGFIKVLRRDHGLIHEVDGNPAFGFIHGNWALDNSHPDGKWCGLNNELTLLRKLGCYADFTLPAAPDPCQTRRVNSIYWATDDPMRPRSHDDGSLVTVNGTSPAEGLLMVQGPLGLYWPDGQWLKPALEVGELAGHNPVTARRVAAWLRLAPRIGNHLFLKLHAHGAPEKNADSMLTGGLSRTLQLMKRECEQRGWKLAYASAWEMYLAILDIANGMNPEARLE